MMTDLSLIIKSTIQAVVLSSVSNILAQCIACYNAGIPFTIDPAPVMRFAAYAVLSCPPNVMWQSYLESSYPGYKVSTKDGRSRRQLDYGNTLIKFLLDQTLGALGNTVAFIVGMDYLRGQTDTNLVFQHVISDSWPLMKAGIRLWPAVSLLSFTLVPLQYRTGFGGLAGIGWNIYLSLVEGKKRTPVAKDS